MNQRMASIIIRTLNESKHLGRLLDSIQQQSYKNFEVIIVDSGSTDNTLEIAGKYQVNLVTLKPEEFSFGRSLNLGCQVAQGEYLVFVSGHTYPQNADWLGNLLQPFEDKKIAMVYGRQVGQAVTKLSEERDLRANFGEKSRILVEEPVGNNANAAIRRSLWTLHPFNEVLPGLEDVEWARRAQRLGYYVYYRADAVIVHIHEENYRQVYLRFKREAQAFRSIFPEEPWVFHKEILSMLMLMSYDLYFGLIQKRSWEQLLSVIPYRLAERKGMLDAYRGKTNITADLNFPKANFQVVITSPHQHQLISSPIPILQPGEILINIKYAAVCSTDQEVLKGELAYYRSGWASYPIVPGHEFAGVVAAVGSGVKGFVVGGKVVAESILGCGECQSCQDDRAINCMSRKEVGVLNFDGGYAQYLKIPARFGHKLPADTKLLSACLVEPLAVCVKGVKKLLAGENGRSKNAAVIGFGTIGYLCAQLLRQKGCTVTVFDKNPLKLQGIDEYRLLAGSTLEDLKNYDLVIEATGSIEALRTVMNFSATGAKILLLGLPYAAMEYDFESLVCSDKTVIGSVGSGASDFEEAIRLLPVIQFYRLTRDVFKLKDYVLAWKMHTEGKVAKAILALEEV